MHEHLRKLIFQSIDQTISRADFDRLQDAIESDEQVRTEYLRALNLCENLEELATSEHDQLARAADPTSQTAAVSLPLSALWLALAASLLILVGGVAYTLGRGSGAQNTPRLMSSKQPLQKSHEQPLQSSEKTLSGYATLRRSVDIKWSTDAPSYRDGDVLPAGVLQFDKGIAEIDFFCGATLLVEGPAKMDLESDWSVRFLQGRLRASVPPAARGFTVKAADSEIFDLGTEFSLDVNQEHARVEVLDGEVELRGGDHDGNRLLTGQSRWLKGVENGATSARGFSTRDEIRLRSEAAQRLRLEKWQAHSEALRADERLITYYPIASFEGGRMLPNASSNSGQRDGALVGMVNHSEGRFGAISSSLGFHRPGSRVRVMIDGEYSAFTFTCWAKIDSLDHKFNALFLADSYENGEPHWQIRDDGRLMFSVMVDDTKDVYYGWHNEIKAAGHQWVYFSDPVWDVSMSGQWIHIAAVYDPARRQVTQYLNGDQVSHEAITDEYYIDTLRIGAGEIGNWGQPFRKTPGFFIRNLNGAIDELAIYNASLTAEEIKDTYEQGKPLGY